MENTTMAIKAHTPQSRDQRPAAECEHSAILPGQRLLLEQMDSLQNCCQWDRLESATSNRQTRS